jgi:ABC-2 type transport system ATP-binding protein
MAVAVASDDVILHVDRLTKSFADKIALRDLSFSARRGEVIGLLGPNGAGKTTAIRILSTILGPTRGTFRFAGFGHGESAAIRRRIGVLPESAGYPLHWSGTEFLEFHARLFGYARGDAAQIAQSLLTRVGLDERASSPVRTYSRGMRQRLGVARALVNEPQLVFLDEPTLGLDPAGQREILLLIRELAHERGTTVILSTHFLDEVEEVCSRLLILSRGALLADGSVAEIKRRAAPRSARIQVPAEQCEQAEAIVSALEGVSGIGSRNVETGALTADFEPRWVDAHPGTGTNAPVAALAAAGIPIISFEVEGGRLSDAFLALTQEDE